MKNVYGKNVIVTGATSGIGKSIALKLAEEGCNVIGIGLGVENHTEGNIRYINLDVTDEEKVKEVFKDIKEVDIAILAAGFGIAGPAEIMPIEYARKQMEINYFGVMNMCSNIIPLMRQKKKGLIVAISSVAGKVTLPMQSHYSSSKYALEAYIEALRMELRDFNIKTCLVEPGDTKTGFTGARKTYNPEGNPYYDVCTRSVEKQRQYEIHGKPPETVRDTVLKVIGKKNPPVRVAVGFEYKVVMLLIRILPSKALDSLLYKIYMPKK